MQIEIKSSETDVEICQFQQIVIKHKQKAMKWKQEESKVKQKVIKRNKK